MIKNLMPNALLQGLCSVKRRSQSESAIFRNTDFFGQKRYVLGARKSLDAKAIRPPVQNAQGHADDVLSQRTLPVCDVE
ncbi:MAG: hypothetical protein ABSD12_12860 [Paraburkholderia sp.]